MRATLVFVFCTLVHLAMAQPMRQSSPEDIIGFGYEMLEKKDYINALDFLNQAYENDNENLQLVYDIGKTYEKIRDYKKAERWYRLLLRKDKEGEFPEIKLDLARMLKISNKYEEASDAFYDFLTNSENDSLKAIARTEIQGIELALTGEEPLDLLIDNESVGVNTMFSEYSPTWDTEGSMYYSGYDRKDLIIVDGSEDDYHAKIYKAAAPEEPKEEEEESTRRRRTTKKKKSASEALGDHINREGFHTSNVSISADGERMYFTRQVLESNNILESKIFMSQSNGGEWAPPSELPRVNGDHIATMPAEGELFGNRVLYFCSDQVGGEGGFDIYYSTIRSNGDYSTPVNLGTQINTPGHEYTPFYRTGILYFSSNHLPGLGGFDVYSSRWNGAEWADPENLGKGYNSSVDDLYFRIDESGYNGFIVSNRPGTKSTLSKTCCDDIFIISKKKLVIDLLTGVVDEDNKALNGAVVQLIDITSGENGETKTQSQERDYLFKFPLEEERMYKAVVTRPGYEKDSVLFDSKGITESFTIQKKVILKKSPIIVDKNKDENVTVITRNQSIRLRNIYYDLDDDKILTDAEKDLNTLLELLNTYPTMVIELSSHTDAQGNDDYNQNLSQRRSNSARAWLIAKNVNPDRLVSKGYGEEFILNQCENGIDCSDDEHRYNRRTEFKMIAGPKTIEIKSSAAGGRTPADVPSVLEQLIEKQGPELYCPEKKVDLGVIKFGEKKKHFYTIVNTGDEDLIIEHASACTCTEVDYPIDPIKPGMTALINIEYDSAKKDEEERFGLQEVIVELITNLPERFVDLEFTIFVEAE